MTPTPDETKGEAMTTSSGGKFWTISTLTGSVDHISGFSLHVSKRKATKLDIRFEQETAKALCFDDKPAADTALNALRLFMRGGLRTYGVLEHKESVFIEAQKAFNREPNNPDGAGNGGALHAAVKAAIAAYIDLWPAPDRAEAERLVETIKKRDAQIAELSMKHWETKAAQDERDRANLALRKVEEDRNNWARLLAQIATNLGCHARGDASGNDHVVERARFLGNMFDGERYVATERERQRAEKAEAALAEAREERDQWREKFQAERASFTEPAPEKVGPREAALSACSAGFSEECAKQIVDAIQAYHEAKGRG